MPLGLVGLREQSIDLCAALTAVTGPDICRHERLGVIVFMMHDNLRRPAP